MTTPTDTIASIVAELRDGSQWEDSFDHCFAIELANRLEKLSAASVQVTDWQPIESAPKDGTNVLLGYEAKDKECAIVHSEDPSAPEYLALGAVKVTRERCG